MSTISNLLATTARPPVEKTAAATPSSGSSSSSTVPTEASGANQTLTQADFLKIMVAQFSNQDPLSSSDGSGNSSGTSDYVNELIAMTNLTTQQTISQQQALQLASTLPNATVTISVNNSTVSGVVSNATIQNATLYVTVNGTQYPASDLTSVVPATATPASTTPATSGTTSGTTGTSTTPTTTP
jgi:flagellar hook assembly protein FlgD